MTTKDLIVYVTGISGMCSKGYTGCGKSCLCRQFMYNEYMEESYSTLGQAEFESHVINQEHTIYWGQKKQTYLLSAEEMNMQSVTVNFEVFEHTTLYQDDTNEPFHGHDNYESRIFTPYTSFQNKHAFRSCQNILNPEGYDRKFLLSSNVTVAYLYVVDVSQSCSIFEAQMQLMSRLVRSIQNTHCCVVVASKFDTHCEKNVKFLESFANAMNIAIIKCSSKHNANVDIAFECLAVEALSLKQNTVEVIQRQTWFADCHKDMEQHTRISSTPSPFFSSATYPPSGILYHKELACSQDNLCDKKKIRKRDRLSSAFGKIFFNRKPIKISKHHITMPTTYIQNDPNSTLGLPTLLYNGAISSCPDLSSASPETGNDISHNLANSTGTLHYDSKPTADRSEKPFLSIPSEEQNHANDQANHPKLYSRSTMPLPLTPLDLVTSRDSVSTILSSTSSSSSNSAGSTSSCISSAGMKDCSLSTIVFSTTFVDDIDIAIESDNRNDAQEKKHVNYYEIIDFDSPLNPQEELPSNSGTATTADSKAATSIDDGERTVVAFDNTQDNKEIYTAGNNDVKASNVSVNDGSSDKSPASDTKTTTCWDEDEGYVISNQEFFKGLGQTQQTSTDYLTIISTDTGLSNLCLNHTEEQHCKQQGVQRDMKGKVDIDSPQVENIYDRVISEYVVYAGQSTVSEQYKSSKPDSFMHRMSARNGSQIHTYDYIDRLYLKRLRLKKHCSGVPPRKVKREGYKPLVGISACSNATKTHHATYVNCSNIQRRQYGTTLLPPRQGHTDSMDKTDSTPKAPPRSIPRPGHYLSSPSAVPTT